MNDVMKSCAFVIFALTVMLGAIHPATARAQAQVLGRASQTVAMHSGLATIAGPIDLDWWCKKRFGPSARAVIVAWNVYG